DNTPLRGGKHNDYEGGVRVPFLICWPAQLKPGEWEAPVTSLDILPTALAAAGTGAAEASVSADSANAKSPLPFDGINLLPILQGATPPPASRDFFWCSGSIEGWWAVRSGDWKLVGEKGKLSLFDLSKDVSESNDLAAKMPDKVAELTKLHDTWLTQMPKPVKEGEKRYDMAAQTGKKPKKMTKEEKQKAREMERAKKRPPSSPSPTPEAPKP
ncbi:MAG: sulfatase-like hydrolase/transferase, partial [Prosthecobacter sp.]|nr:sulfatase-like hydrolase/transferase [Prosthecobacter sp.]